MESRRVWEGVTTKLKKHRLEEAAATKLDLEERQRREAKDRQEKQIVYKQKVNTG